jgi:dUTPase
MKLKVKKLHPDAIIPKYAHHDDAGVDLFCVEAFELKPGERKSIPTGISMEIPEGFVGLIWDKLPRACHYVSNLCCCFECADHLKPHLFDWRHICPR